MNARASRLALCAFSLAAVILLTTRSLSAQDQPAATAPPASAPTALPGASAATSEAAASAPATRPSADSLIPARRAAFTFSNTPIADMVSYVSHTWDVQIVDSYKLADRVTMTIPGEISGREAIDLVDQTLLPMGYTMVEEVKGTPPLLVLRVTPISRELGLQVYISNDPEKIPDTDELRTQVFILRNADLQKTREMILPVLDKKSDVVVNPSTHTLYITDTAAHLHTAAVLIQVLEKQAAAAP